MTEHSTQLPHHSDFTRRSLLGVIAVASAATLVAPPGAAEPQRAKHWSDTLSAIEPRLKEVRDRIDEYLYTIAAAASQLPNVPRGELQRVDWTDPAVSFGMAFKGTSFVVVEWELAPNAILPPHNHPNGSVCTVGVEGEAFLENFEVSGAASAVGSETPFTVRRTKREVIARGRVNTLSPTRDNIHTLRAGSRGARGIDITSMHGPSEKFGFLKLKERAGGELFEARWFMPGK